MSCMWFGRLVHPFSSFFFPVRLRFIQAFPLLFIYCLFHSVAFFVSTDKCRARFTVSSTATVASHTNLFDLRLWYIWISWWWFVNIWTFQPIPCVSLSELLVEWKFDCNVSECCCWISTHFVPVNVTYPKYIHKRLHLNPWINWTVACARLNIEIEWEISYGFQSEIEIISSNETNLSVRNSYWFESIHSIDFELSLGKKRVFVSPSIHI